MKFTYENQGAVTYLVCELEAAEQLDSLTLGMLTNNHIPGFAPVLYTEMNGQRYLKYNISAKVNADQFFAGSMNKQRVLTAFHNILSAICSADDYMIDLSSFVVDSGYVYLNVSSCETAMICVPVITEKNLNADLAALFRKIMFTTQFDSTEDASYITQLITYVNSGPAFTVYGMNDLVTKLLSGAPVESPAAPAAAPAPAAPVINQAPAAPVIQQQPPKAPTVSGSPFDSTISIDDMPAMMAQKQAQPTIQPAPAAPIKPAPQPEPPKMPMQSFAVQSAPVKPQQSVVPQQSVKPQQPPVPNAGFAIPGQPMGAGVPVPPAPSAPQKPGKAPKPPKQPKPGKQPKAEETGEKKISFFGLMSHYSKENAELYKKQKEEAKAKKAAAAPAKPAQKPVTPPVNVPGQMPPQQPPMGVPPMGAPMQQQYAQPQYQPAVRPVPVQNSFNETTVLSPAMMGGETTVLSAAPMRPDPALTRVKTGERISINKPVFRIGKEKSYVDYFIGDNTAISRSHANIHCDNGEYFVEDTNSTNHTYLNGKLINSNEKVKLTNGDKVRLANEDFTFSV